jgi:hypothetical protein
LPGSGSWGAPVSHDSVFADVLHPFHQDDDVGLVGDLIIAAHLDGVRTEFLLMRLFIDRHRVLPRGATSEENVGVLSFRKWRGKLLLPHGLQNHGVAGILDRPLLLGAELAQHLLVEMGDRVDHEDRPVLVRELQDVQEIDQTPGRRDEKILPLDQAVLAKKRDCGVG